MPDQRCTSPHHRPLSGGRCAQLSDPLDAESAFLLPLADADYFPWLEAGFDANQAGTVMADIKTGDVFREHLSLGVGTEDPNRNSNRLPGFASLAHKFRGGKIDAN